MDENLCANMRSVDFIFTNKRNAIVTSSHLYVNQTQNYVGASSRSFVMQHQLHALRSHPCELGLYALRTAIIV